ncbi:MAG: HD domain-containing protein [Bacilli bacterium]|nr:HD domain-containing protein [Bacilli bacterium]
MEDYIKYQQYISDIPDFLYKYLDLDIMLRLKDISVLCGMDNASKDIYNFKFYMSRFNHSLNVALITWRLTNDKTQTLAALFHDVSTPVFSHVIDYMNGDYVNQESTESKTKDVLLSSRILLDYLKEDNIDINNIIDFKAYSIVDLPRPALCADRLDNLIGGGMCWAKNVELSDAKSIIDNLTTCINESGQQEITLYSLELCKYLRYINNEINRLTHTQEDTYMMMLLASITRCLIKSSIISYDDLYKLTEPQIVYIIKQNLDIPELYRMWNTFRTITKPVPMVDVKIKEMSLEPYYKGRRINI